MSLNNSYVLFGGDVILYVEDGAIMLRTCDPSGDAVELKAEEAATLSRLLGQLADKKDDGAEVMQRPIDVPTVIKTDPSTFMEWTLDGPGYPGLRWLPITYDHKTSRGSYYFHMLPGSVTKPHTHPNYEEFFVIEGEAIESGGRIVKTGDFVSFKPGSFHNTRTETGCLMIVFEWAPA